MVRIAVGRLSAWLVLAMGFRQRRKFGRGFGIRSIFVTANADPATLSQAQGVDPIGVLEKPLTVKRLKAKLALVDGRDGIRRL